MLHEVFMPVTEAGMTRATLIEWLAEEGEKINAYEPLFTIETDKVTLEIEAEQGGVIRKQLFTPNSIVPVQSVVAVITDTPDEPIDLSDIEKKNKTLIKNLPPEEE